MAITSPFFCLADFLCCRLQPAERLLLLCLTPHLGANQRFDDTTGFVIVPYSRIHQTTLPSLLSIQHCRRLKPFRLHPNTPVFPYR